MDGYYPFRGILGHEFVGIVAEAQGDNSWIGKRVVGGINASCGACENCNAGLPSHCERRTVLGIVDRHGAFAEYLTLPVINLHEVPASIPDEAAVFTEPLAAALEIQEQVQIHPEDHVLLIGAGNLGQLIAQTLILTGCDLQVVARYETQRALLDTHNIATIAEDAVLSRKMDVVIEASGSPGGLELALEAVRPRGTIVLKSTYKGMLEIDSSSIVVNEIKLVGSRCGPFKPALSLFEKGEVDPTPLITERYPLSHGLRALRHAGRPGVLKVLLQP
jgi:threonine dehydrogenase-like Zn-dependent dehydrogenase